MDVILLENIRNLGKMGDVVKVRDGYGRNFLLKSGKALRADKENINFVYALCKSLKIRDKLFGLLYIKESTSHFIWYTLIGILCCLVNFNYILTSDCIKSMEQIDDDYANQTESINNTETPTTNYNTNNTVEI